MSTILIVDDDVCLGFLLAEYLSTVGHRCIRVENVAGARAHLRTNQVDLVISDVNMPGESGFDLLHHVSSCYPQISLLLMSAMDDAESRQRAAQMGACGYLVKPFKFGNLRAQLAAIAQQNNHQRFPEQSPSSTV